MTFEVRRARPEEFAEAGEATAAAYREFARPGDEDWERYLARIRDVDGRADRAVILVAVEEGGVLGSATLELEARVSDDHEPLAPDEAHVRMLGVRPEARRRGVARALIAGCVGEARRAGKARLTLNTTERMRAARAMYEALGFARGADRVFPDGFVLLSYELAMRDWTGT
jgi:ribosomal protein S18 acetylase RimI-like enzyme